MIIDSPGIGVPGFVDGSLLRRFQPKAQSTAPPATCTTPTERPNTFSTYAPKISDPMMSRNELTATFAASCARVSSSAPCVIARNIGADPTGLTIGNMPPTTRRRAVRK